MEYKVGYKFNYRNLDWEIIQVIEKLNKLYICRNEKGITECFDQFNLRGL